MSFAIRLWLALVLWGATFLGYVIIAELTGCSVHAPITVDNQPELDVELRPEENMPEDENEPRIRKPYSAPERVTTPAGGPSLTKQSFARESDINAIIRKWSSTQEIPRLNAKTPLYGDFSNVDDYLSALTFVRAAQADFEALPAELRALCANDPAEFLSLASTGELGQVFADAGYAQLAEQLGFEFEVPAPQNTSADGSQAEAPTDAESAQPTKSSVES